MSFLFDEWPSGEAHRPASGSDAVLPILGRAAKADTDTDKTSAEDSKPEPPPAKPANLVWAMATTLLVLLTFANIAWTFREPLLSNPRINTWMQQAGWLQVE